jgi:hypothetical protein
MREEEGVAAWVGGWRSQAQCVSGEPGEIGQIEVSLIPASARQGNRLPIARRGARDYSIREAGGGKTRRNG